MGYSVSSRQSVQVRDGALPELFWFVPLYRIVLSIDGIRSTLRRLCEEYRRVWPSAAIECAGRPGAASLSAPALISRHSATGSQVSSSPLPRLSLGLTPFRWSSASCLLSRTRGRCLRSSRESASATFLSLLRAALSCV